MHHFFDCYCRTVLDPKTIAAQDYLPRCSFAKAGYAYGNLIISYNNGTPNEKYKLTQKERDTETNYDYFGVRYYDSDLGRWMSVDPLAVKYPSWSPYNYTLGNPVRFVDPNGMEPEWTKDDLFYNLFEGGNGFDDLKNGWRWSGNNDGDNEKNKPIFLNPTGGRLRGRDAQGEGYYGATRRNSKTGNTRPHLGLDFVSDVGQEVVASFDGVASINKGSKGGVILISKDKQYRLWLFYITPNIQGEQQVTRGQTIGIANDITQKYPGITNHVHGRLDLLGKQNFIDPTPYFFPDNQ